MKEDRFTIFVVFVSSISAVACLAEVDEGDDILVVCVRGRELEREGALVGLGPGIASPKNNVVELACS
jgi:hypothetical protein